MFTSIIRFHSSTLSFRQGGQRHDTGVVDHHVHPAVGVGGVGDELLDVSGVGDIQAAKRRGTAGGLDSLDQGFEPFGASGAEEEPVTVVGEPQRGGFADSTAGAGDQDCLRVLGHDGVPFRRDGLLGGQDGDLGEVDVAGDGGHEGDGLGDVGGLEDVDVVDEVGHQLGGVGVGDVVGQFGVDHAGFDGGDADHLAAEFDAQQPGEVADVGLGAGVDRELLQDAGGRDGGGVDQVGGLALSAAAVRCGRNAAMTFITPGDVEVDLALPVVDLELLDAGDELDAGVVEHEVGRAEAVGDLVGGGLDGGAVGDVDGQGERGAAGGLDARRQASSLSLRRAATTTLAPSSARRSAVAAPMPLEAPVTTATRPANGAVVITVDMCSHLS